MPSPELRLVAAATLIIVTALLWAGQVMGYQHQNFPRPWDHHKYLEMAESDLLDFHIAPYAWRVGTPLVANILPFDLMTSFLLITFLSTWITAILIYCIARKLGFSPWIALTGSILWLTLDWGARFYLLDFWLVDPFAELFIVAAIYAALVRRSVLFIVLITLGVTVKESVIFVAPLYYSLSTTRLVDARLALRTMLFTIPPVIMLFIIRSTIPAWNDDPEYVAELPKRLWLVQLESARYDPLWYLRVHGLDRSRYLTVDALRMFTVGAYGLMLVILPLFSIRKNLWLALRFLPFLLLVYSQTLFGDGRERYIVVAAPIVVLLALNGVEAIRSQLEIRDELMVLLPLTLLVVVIIRRYWFFTPIEVQALAFGLSLAAIFQLRGVFPTTLGPRRDPPGLTE